MNKYNQGKRSKSVGDKYPVNADIKTAEMTVIGEDGTNYGLISRNEALGLAESKNLDLVQVGEKDGVAVTKLMDFGKFLYEKKKQVGDAKKTQKTMQLKEIKLRPHIGDQDYETKLKKAVQFFGEGRRVKFTLQFKGREITMMKDLSPLFFARISKSLEEKEVGPLVEEKEQRGNSYWSKTYFVKTK